MGRKIFLVVSLLVAAEISGWIWGLWPLSDPSFDWGKYFDEAVAARDCDTAFWLATNAVPLNEERGLAAARTMSAASWCPDGAKAFDEKGLGLIAQGVLLRKDHPGEYAHGYTWAPGWDGRLRALPWIIGHETHFVYAAAARKHGPLLAAVEFPGAMPWSLRCNFALLEQPGAAYHAMRQGLARTAHAGLALPDWDARQTWCLGVERLVRNASKSGGVRGAAMRIRGRSSGGLPLASALLGAGFGADTEAAAAQSRPFDALLGDWHGTSICLVKPSACHDEEALYRAKIGPAGQLQIEADKIVDGKPEDMGTVDCAFDAPTSRVHCAWPHGILDLTLQGDHLDGTMSRPDKTPWRDIKLTRVKP